MHCEAIGKLQGIELLFLIRHHALVIKTHCHHVFGRIDAQNKTNIPIEHPCAFFIAKGGVLDECELVVILGLDHLVPNAKLGVPVDDAVCVRSFGIEGILEHFV